MDFLALGPFLGFWLGYPIVSLRLTKSQKYCSEALKAGGRVWRSWDWGYTLRCKGNGGQGAPRVCPLHSALSSWPVPSLCSVILHLGTRATGEHQTSPRADVPELRLALSAIVLFCC